MNNCIVIIIVYAKVADRGITKKSSCCCIHQVVNSCKQNCSKNIKKLIKTKDNIYFDLICNLHTYLIGQYNTSVRIFDLVSHTTYVVCVNLIHKWRDLRFKIDSERQIFLRGFIYVYFIYPRSFRPTYCI